MHIITYSHHEKRCFRIHKGVYAYHLEVSVIEWIITKSKISFQYTLSHGRKR